MSLAGYSRIARVAEACALDRDCRGEGKWLSRLIIRCLSMSSERPEGAAASWRGGKISRGLRGTAFPSILEVCAPVGDVHLPRLYLFLVRISRMAWMEGHCTCEEEIRWGHTLNATLRALPPTSCN